MKKLKVNFVDFWPNLYKEDNYFYNLLSLKYDVQIDEDHPDVLFFSVDYEGRRERDRYQNCLKVFYTGENIKPNNPRYNIGGGSHILNTFYDECDISFSFERSDDPKNYRLPLWALHLNWFNRPYIEQRDQAYLHPVEDFLNKEKPKTKEHFCSFIATQNKGYRTWFVPKLINTYKHVHCAGGLHNNTGGAIQGRGDQAYKIEFLKHFKFNVAFENCSSEGYATEKIIHSMFANSVPIYWGDPSIHLDFNKNSFLTLKDLESHEELIEKIKEIDQDDKKYKDMLAQPWFTNNEIPDFVQPENVLGWLDKHLP